jgi:hypothetical protein
LLLEHHQPADEEQPVEKSGIFMVNPELKADDLMASSWLALLDLHQLALMFRVGDTPALLDPADASSCG